MKKKHSFTKLKNWFSSNWVVPFVTTTLGVFLGFYMNNYNNQRQLIQKQEKALSFVAQELEENQKNLEAYGAILEDNFSPLNYLLSTINNKQEIVIHKDSLSVFKNRTKTIFQYQSYTNLPNDFLSIKGKLNMNINSNLIAFDLSHIIWDTYKQTEYLSETSFNCITQLESVYSLIKKFNVNNNEWRQEFYNGSFRENARSRSLFMDKWHSLLQEKKLILAFIENQKELLKSCK